MHSARAYQLGRQTEKEYRVSRQQAFTVIYYHATKYSAVTWAANGANEFVSSRHFQPWLQMDEMRSQHDSTADDIFLLLMAPCHGSGSQQ